MKRTVRFLWAWLPVFVVMALIFYFSHQQGTASSKLSSSITTIVFDICRILFPFWMIDFHLLHSVIRKSAHFTIYFILGVTLIRACTFYFPPIKRSIYAFLIACFYAITDEVHQLFVPGRSGEIGDVLIDSIGACLGIVVYSFRRKKCENVWKK